MGKIKFRMAARCESAGRPNNEDNFQLSENLSGSQWGFSTDKQIELGEKGCLMVVADGMGGMNAGEVASAIAVETIKNCFDCELLTDAVLQSPEHIERYITQAIVEADAQIKKQGHADEEKSGMGSTIVLAWLLGDKVYIGWCGDSRAYRFNPEDGLKQLSHDHSYVQELVDAGKLKEEYAFDHPENNIITRSLGDPRRKARPDVEAYELRNNDIIFLCSDGLSGVLRDHELEAIVRDHTESMADCRDALWQAAEQAGWHDNVTLCLCQILSGAAKVTSVVKGDNQRGQISTQIKVLIVAGILLSFLTGGALGYFLSTKTEFPPKEKEYCEYESERLRLLSLAVGSLLDIKIESDSMVLKMMEDRFLYPADSISTDSLFIYRDTLYSIRDTILEKRRMRITNIEKEEDRQELYRQVEIIEENNFTKQVNDLDQKIDRIEKQNKGNRAERGNSRSRNTVPDASVENPPDSTQTAGPTLIS